MSLKISTDKRVIKRLGGRNVIDVYACLNLEVIEDIDDEVGYLFIYGCPKLKKLPTCRIKILYVQASPIEEFYLPRLLKLTLVHCPIKLIPSSPNLIRLDLYYCNNINKIVNLPTLRDMGASNCRMLLEIETDGAMTLFKCPWVVHNGYVMDSNNLTTLFKIQKWLRPILNRKITIKKRILSQYFCQDLIEEICSS